MSDQASSLPCCIPVHVGLFFDGTNNNMERDLNGKRIGLAIDPQTKKPVLMPNRKMVAEQCSHSNVVRLHRAFPGDKQSSGYYRNYIPGVGTEFEKIGEPTESTEGKAFAKGGQPRIMWGIFQVLNAIHRTAFEDAPLYDDDKVGEFAQAYGNEADRSEQDASGDSHYVSHKGWFSRHLDKLKAALAAKKKPEIPSLRLSVFGFSRGAAEAVAFCHFFNDLLEDGKLIGISTDICFLGLFDVVASVGTSDSMRKTMPGPDWLFDGHRSWAKRILDPLPACVKAGKHFISAHELRMNFPVTVIQGNIEEVYFPGVHSDVGGGYAPGEQGKSRGAQAELLSQIPLVHMYKAALLAGVPLTPFSELEARDRNDFKINPGLASAWEAYTEALAGKGGIVKGHMGLYYRWRAARLDTLERASNFASASAQDQQDMREANRMLVGDLAALRLRKQGRPLDRYACEIALRNLDMQKINQFHWVRAQTFTSLDEWEVWALGVFDKPEPLPDAVMTFFDDYVHDSFAGFYMAGDVTEYDKRKTVARVMDKSPERSPERLNCFERKVYDTSMKAEAASKKKAAGDALTPEEESLARESENGTPYPVMTDDDSADMRNWVIQFQTRTRREGGGYIIRRGYYPMTGFIWRQFIREQELERVAAAHYIWSDNLSRDIPASRTADVRHSATA